jgi:hypothetical protein
MTTYHLAQINLALMRAPLDTPVMADFVARLEEINVEEMLKATSVV